MKFFFPVILLCAALSLSSSAAGQEAVFSGKPLRVGVAGLVHGYVHWILGRPGLRGAQQVSPLSLSSLENNLIVVEILEAARKSAKKGKTIDLKP